MRGSNTGSLPETSISIDLDPSHEYQFSFVDEYGDKHRVVINGHILAGKLIGSPSGKGSIEVWSSWIGSIIQQELRETEVIKRLTEVEDRLDRLVSHLHES